jgi:hypothetical protein
MPRHSYASIVIITIRKYLHSRRLHLLSTLLLVRLPRRAYTLPHNSSVSLTSRIKAKVTSIQRRWHILLKLGTTVIRARERTLAMRIAAHSIARTAALTFARWAAILLFRALLIMCYQSSLSRISCLPPPPPQPPPPSSLSHIYHQSRPIRHPFDSEPPQFVLRGNLTRCQNSSRWRPFCFAAVTASSQCRTSIIHRQSTSTDRILSILFAANAVPPGCPFPSRPWRNATP